MPFLCHSYGMVGFVKELVDEQGTGSITLRGKEKYRRWKFEGLLVTPGVVVVTKLAPTVEVVSKSRTRKRRAR